MARVTVGSLELAYAEHGEGPATVLVHGMASSAAGWELGGVGGRVIAYDRRGYGDSQAPQPYTGTTVNEQAEDLGGLVEALGAAPAVLVGDGFGALVVLDVLLRRRDAARAAVLVDPPLYAFMPEATEELSAERFALEEGLREGGPEEAVARWLGAGADPARVVRARRDAHAFFADYSAVSTLPLTRGDLRGLSVPVGVVGTGEPVLDLVPGARAYADWREAVAALA